MEAGYLTDTPYTGDFYDHLAPAWLNYIAAINGYPTRPLDERFTWCELGCGKGASALLLAANYPQGEFHACDLSSEHIRYAEQVRAAGGIANVALYAKSVAQMLDEDLPPLDFVVLHGLYSWVPQEVREDIHRFLQKQLKPGGLAMVSYNAMPGWAALAPLRRLMYDYAQGLPGDAIERMRGAYAHADVLAKSGAAFFAHSPAAVTHLREMAARDIRYLAHEYLTPHAEAFYVADVARALGAVGLSFAGSMTAWENDPQWMVPAPFRRLLTDAPGRVMREAQFDFIADTRFRRDLYVGQSQTDRQPGVRLADLDALHFALADLPERLASRPVPPLVQQDLQSSAHLAGAVYERLLTGPCNAREIQATTGLSAQQESAMLIQQLVAAGHLVPCSPVRPAAGWMSINTAMIDTALREQLPRVPLACRQNGAASYCEVVYAAAIQAAAQFDRSGDAADSALARLRQHGHPVNRTTASGEKRAASDPEIRQYIAATWQRLRDPSQPDTRRLRLVGILA